jgi:hypothetical protein
MKTNTVTALKTPPPPALTLGAVRARLIENGFEPCSALMPVGPWVSTHAPHFAPVEDFSQSEHPAAVRLQGRQRLILLLTSPLEDEELARRVHALLDEHGLRSGPARRGSDGTSCHVLQGGRYLEPFSVDALEGRVRFLSSATVVLPLDGSWSASVLDTSCEHLPLLTREQADALCTQITRLPWAIAEERRPAPAPAKKGWLGR